MSEPPTVAVVFRGDADLRRSATPANTRLAPVFTALAQGGLSAVPAVYSDEWAGEVRDQLLAARGVLVWVDPVAGDGDRSVLDGILREVSDAGVWVAAHPEVIAKMGTKEVLYTTKDLGWGADTHLYRTYEEFERAFPPRLGAYGIRVLKAHRGNAGTGVWKVMVPGGRPGARTPQADDLVLVQHALVRDETVEEVTLGGFMAGRAPAFSAYGGTGRLVDQAFCRRIDQGIVRCYVVRDRVVGFARQYPRGLSPEERAAEGFDPDRAPPAEQIMGLPSRKVMYGPEEPAFQVLRNRLEEEWLPAMQRRLEIGTDQLPALWDADFLFGPETADGADTYVLCEINASSVMPFPAETLPALVGATQAALDRSVGG